MKSTPSEPASLAPATWALVMAFVAVYISWGTTYLAIAQGVRDEQLPPALFGGSRVFLAGLVILGYLALRRQPMKICGWDWIKVLLSGLLLFVAGNGLINLAEKTVTSGVAAVLAATTPLWVGLLEFLWPAGERLTTRGWLGLLTGLFGVLVLLAPKLGEPSALWHDTGPLLVLGSAFSWALGSLILRHHRLACSHLPAAGWQMVIGGGSLALLGIALGEIQQLPPHLTPGAVAAFVYLLIVGSLVGFVSFNWLLGHVSAAKVGTYAYVNPVVAVLVGWLAGEEITFLLLAGVCIILTGVGLVRKGGKWAVPPADPTRGTARNSPAGSAPQASLPTDGPQTSPAQAWSRS